VCSVEGAMVQWFISQVLSVLVRAVTGNIVAASGDPASHLRPKLLELFGHVTAKVTSVSDIWRLYAELLATSDSMTDTLHDRVCRNWATSTYKKTALYCSLSFFLETIYNYSLCFFFCLTGHF